MLCRNVITLSTVLPVPVARTCWAAGVAFQNDSFWLVAVPILVPVPVPSTMSPPTVTANRPTSSSERVVGADTHHVRVGHQAFIVPLPGALAFR